LNWRRTVQVCGQVIVCELMLNYCIFFRCMITTTKEQLYSFYQFPGSKTVQKKEKISIFSFQEMSLKREIFVNFLPQNFIIKYGIVSTYSVTFVCQKILACLQCLYSDLCLTLVRPLSHSSL